MTLKITASFIVAGISYYAESDSVAGLVDAVAAISTPTTDKVTLGKSAETALPAASPSPAPAETIKPKKGTTTTASAAGPAPSSPKPSDTKSEPATYEKTGIGDKIAAHLGAKGTEGYAEKRTAVLALLAEYGAKKGPELKPEQFADFEAKLDALIAGPTDGEDDIG